MPHLTAPPKPEVYNTDVSPAAVFSSATIEIIRVKFDDEVSLAVIESAWNDLVASIGLISSAKSSLCGRSINLDGDLFIGMIGWPGDQVGSKLRLFMTRDGSHSQARDTIMETVKVAKSKSRLEGLVGVSSILIDCSTNESSQNSNGKE